MPYEIQPEYDLADLSENEVYKQVTQLAAERQLVEELGILNDDAVLNAAVTDLEVYCIDVEQQNQPVPLGRVERVRMNSAPRHCGALGSASGSCTMAAPPTS